MGNMQHETLEEALDTKVTADSHLKGIPSGVATRKGIKVALKIKEIQCKVGFCSLEKLAEAYQSGSADFPKHLAITTRKIRNADIVLIVGDDPDRIRGRAQFPRNVPASAEKRVNIVAGELVVQIDLMFEKGLTFLVAIVDPMAHMLVNHTNSKSAENIWPKLQRHIHPVL